MAGQFGGPTWLLLALYRAVETLPVLWRFRAEIARHLANFVDTSLPVFLGLICSWGHSLYSRRHKDTVTGSVWLTAWQKCVDAINPARRVRRLFHLQLLLG